jgi:hypothetical protein
VATAWLPATFAGIHNKQLSFKPKGYENARFDNEGAKTEAMLFWIGGVETYWR